MAGTEWNRALGERSGEVGRWNARTDKGKDGNCMGHGGSAEARAYVFWRVWSVGFYTIV